MNNKDDIQSYVNWVKGTLIPDLEEAGQEATAADFDTLVAIIMKHVLHTKEG